MAAVKGLNYVGKSSGIHNHGGVTHDSGKRTPSTFSKVTAAAGKSSGTARNGDKGGCKPMKGC